MVENTFDNNINGNTNNNVETRNTTEGVKTIKSLDQIIDEDIRSKLVEAIKNNHDGIFNLYTYNEETKLNICGYKFGEPRLPLIPMSKEKREILKKCMKNFKD